MKVLLVSSSSGSRGGGEIYLHRLAAGLSRFGLCVRALCSNAPVMDELAENLRRYCQQTHACARHGRNYVMMPHGMLDPYSLRQKRWRKRIYLAASERRNLEGFSRLTFTTFHEQQAAQESLSWLDRLR